MLGYFPFCDNALIPLPNPVCCDPIQGVSKGERSRSSPGSEAYCTPTNKDACPYTLTHTVFLTHQNPQQAVSNCKTRQRSRNLSEPVSVWSYSSVSLLSSVINSWGDPALASWMVGGQQNAASEFYHNTLQHTGKNTTQHSVCEVRVSDSLL